MAPTLDTTPPSGAPFASTIRFDAPLTKVSWTVTLTGTEAGYLNTSTYNYQLRYIAYLQSPFESGAAHNTFTLNLRINGRLIAADNQGNAYGYTSPGWHDYPMGARLGAGGVYFNTAEGTPGFPWTTITASGNTYTNGLEDLEPVLWDTGPWITGDNTVDIMLHLVRSDTTPVGALVTDELQSVGGVGPRIVHLGWVKFTYSDGVTPVTVTLEPANNTGLADVPAMDANLVADPTEQPPPLEPVTFYSDTPTEPYTEWIMVLDEQEYYDEGAWLANGDSDDPITFDYDPVDWIEPDTATVILVIWDAHGYFHTWEATTVEGDEVDLSTDFIWSQITVGGDALAYQMSPVSASRDGSVEVDGFFNGALSNELLLEQIYVPRQVATGFRIHLTPYYSTGYGEGWPDDALVTGTIRAQIVHPTGTIDSSSYNIVGVTVNGLTKYDGVALEWIVPQLVAPNGFWFLLWFNGTTPGESGTHSDSGVTLNVTVYSCINIVPNMLANATINGTWVVQ